VVEYAILALLFFRADLRSKCRVASVTLVGVRMDWLCVCGYDGRISSIIRQVA